MSLQPFEGLDVIQSGIRIVRAGDGLSAALAAGPVELHQGDEVYVLLKCEVTKITHETIKDVDALRRVHTLGALLGTIVDGTWATDAIEAQKKRNLEAAGVRELFEGDE